MRLLSIGYPQSVSINEICALPSRACHLFAMGPGALGAGSNLEFSNDNVTYTATIATPVTQTVGAGFVRVTTGIAIITLKPLG